MTRCCGGAGLTLDRRRGRAELGYWIGRPHWGKGLGQEAAGRLARWALDELGVEAVRASALRDNARSIALLRRLGFRDTGEGAQPFLSRGGAPMPVLLFEAGRNDLAAAAAAAAHRRTPGIGAFRQRGGPLWSPAPWWTGKAACCWPAARKASRWPAFGSSPAARSIPAKRRKRR